MGCGDWQFPPIDWGGGGRRGVGRGTLLSDRASSSGNTAATRATCPAPTCFIAKDVGAALEQRLDPALAAGHPELPMGAHHQRVSPRRPFTRNTDIADLRVPLLDLQEALFHPGPRRSSRSRTTRAARLHALKFKKSDAAGRDPRRRGRMPGRRTDGAPATLRRAHGRVRDGRGVYHCLRTRRRAWRTQTFEHSDQSAAGAGVTMLGLGDRNLQDPPRDPGPHRRARAERAGSREAEPDTGRKWRCSVSTGGRVADAASTFASAGRRPGRRATTGGLPPAISRKRRSARASPRRRRTRAMRPAASASCVPRIRARLIGGGSGRMAPVSTRPGTPPRGDIASGSAWRTTSTSIVGGRPIRPRPQPAELPRRHPRSRPGLRHGPVASGKHLLLAVAAAVHLLPRTQCKIILVRRPAVEVGERLGFRPATCAEVNPTVPAAPRRFARHDGLTTIGFMFNDVVEVVPLAYMRRTPNHATRSSSTKAQNTTRGQMQMFTHGARLEDDHHRRRVADRPADPTEMGWSTPAGCDARRIGFCTLWHTTRQPGAEDRAHCGPAGAGHPSRGRATTRRCMGGMVWRRGRRSRCKSGE